jgi:hypothetical protein
MLTSFTSGTRYLRSRPATATCLRSPAFGLVDWFRELNGAAGPDPTSAFAGRSLVALGPAVISDSITASQAGSAGRPRNFLQGVFVPPARERRSARLKRLEPRRLGVIICECTVRSKRELATRRSVFFKQGELGFAAATGGDQEAGGAEAAECNERGGLGD